MVRELSGGETATPQEIANLLNQGFEIRTSNLSVLGRGQVVRLQRNVRRGDDIIIDVRPSAYNEALEIIRTGSLEPQADKFGTSNLDEDAQRAREQFLRQEREQQTGIIPGQARPSSLAGSLGFQPAQSTQRPQLIETAKQPTLSDYNLQQQAATVSFAQGTQTLFSPGFLRAESKAFDEALQKEITNPKITSTTPKTPFQVIKNIQNFGGQIFPQKIKTGGQVTSSPQTILAKQNLEALQQQNVLQRIASQLKDFTTSPIKTLERSGTQLALLASQPKRTQAQQDVIRALGTATTETANLITEATSNPVRTAAIGAGIIASAAIAPIPVAVGATGLLLQETFTKLNQGQRAGSVITQQIAKTAVPIGALSLEAGILKSTTKTLNRIFTRATAKEVKPETIFAPEVLQQRAGFPTSPSARSALREFQQAPIEKGLLQTVSATTNRFQKQVQVQGTDPQLRGLYVTPKGRGSPYFLRQPGDATRRDLVPTEIISSIRRPTAVQVGVTKVERIPSRVLKADIPAARASRPTRFSSSEEFLRQQASKRPGVAFVGARLELGKTSELEAIIPETSIIQRVPFESKGLKKLIANLRGFEEFTIVKGEVVGVQRFNVQGATRTGRQSITVNQARTRIQKSADSLERIGKRDSIITGKSFSSVRRSTRETSRSAIPTSRIIRDVPRRTRVQTPTRRQVSQPTRRIPVSTVRRIVTTDRSFRIPTQRTTRTPTTRTPINSIYRTPPNRRGGIIPIIETPPPASFNFEPRRFEIPVKSRKKLTRETKFQPSLVGLNLRIKEPKLPKGLTGLEIRGIL